MGYFVFFYLDIIIILHWEIALCFRQHTYTHFVLDPMAAAEVNISEEKVSLLLWDNHEPSHTHSRLDPQAKHTH